MPWEIVKRGCKQSDGKKGKYVVVKKKSKGRTEQESCHTSEKKAKGAVRARYASKSNEGEEMDFTLEDLREMIRDVLSEAPSQDSLDKAKAAAAQSLRDDAEDLQGKSDEELADMLEEDPISETLTEAVMVALQPMIKPVHQEMTRDDFWMKIAGLDSLNEGDLVRLPPPALPSEFGPKGYMSRPELKDKMSQLDIRSDTPPEYIVAVALSNRAEELAGFQRTYSPSMFSRIGSDIYQDLTEDGESLSYIIAMIDSGGPFDDEIIDIVDADAGLRAITQMRQDMEDPSREADLAAEFEDYLAGLESPEQNLVDLDLFRDK